MTDQTQDMEQALYKLRHDKKTCDRCGGELIVVGDMKKNDVPYASVYECTECDTLYHD